MPQGHCVQGTPLSTGDLVRLQHAASRRWLHSHLFSSPLSSNQEVSCFGDDDQSDTGDHWYVELDDAKAARWQRDAGVRLRHKDTGAYLASHDVKYQRPIPGHTEVHGIKSKGAATLWRATEGVYFPEDRTKA